LLGETNTPEEFEKIIEYNKQDVEITKQLFEKLEDMFKPLEEYLPPRDRGDMKYLMFPSGTFAYKAICYAAGLEERYSDVKIEDKEKLEGAYVKQPTLDRYVGYIYWLDIGSAYPHAFMHGNLYTPANSGKCGCQGKCSKVFTGNKLFPIRGTYCAVKLGKIEEVLKDLFGKRAIYKKNKDKREYPLKIYSNTIYGISGNPKFDSIYNIITANDCTSMVRNEIKFAEDEYNASSYEVIYIDTDALFIYVTQRTQKTDEDIESIKQYIVDTIKANVPFPQETFNFSYETGLKAIFFSKGNDDELNKKHYIYVTEKDTIGQKGIAVVKRNCTQLSKNIYAKLKPSIIKTLVCRQKKSLILSMIKEEMDKDYRVAAIRYSVRDSNSYKDTNCIQFQIAEKFGAGKHKLIKNKRIGVGKGVKYCSLEEAKTLKREDFVMDVIMKELEPFTIEEKPQMSLEAYF